MKHKHVLVLPKVAFDNYMSRNKITPETVETSFKKVAFISIHGSDTDTKEKPYFPENKENVLRLFFDDVEEDKIDDDGKILKAFDIEQGHEVINFLEKNKTKNNFIVHCAAGVSRSGAIGTFINDYFRGDYFNFIKENPYIKPNGQVLSILNKIIRDSFEIEE